MSETTLTAEEIGRLIQEHRKSVNLTQEALANELGVSLRTLVRWERGDTEPNHAKVRALLARRIPELAKEWDIKADAHDPGGSFSAFDAMKFLPLAALVGPAGMAAVAAVSAMSHYLKSTPAAAGGRASSQEPSVVGHSTQSTSTSAPHELADVNSLSSDPGLWAAFWNKPGSAIPGVLADEPDMQELRSEIARLRQQLLQLKVDLDEARLENSRQQMRIERLEMVLREHRLM